MSFNLFLIKEWFFLYIKFNIPQSTTTTSTSHQYQHNISLSKKSVYIMLFLLLATSHTWLICVAVPIMHDVCIYLWPTSRKMWLHRFWFIFSNRNNFPSLYASFCFSWELGVVSFVISIKIRAIWEMWNKRDWKLAYMITRWVIFNIYKKHKKEYVGVIDKTENILYRWCQRGSSRILSIQGKYFS